MADAADEPKEVWDELELLELVEPFPLLKLPPLRELDDDEEEREMLLERLTLEDLRLMLDLPEE